MKQGDILQKRYEIRKVLGNGGTSKVYLVFDAHTKKYWALKELCKADANELKREAYETEIKFLQSVTHEAFPVMIDAFETDRAYYYVMEYVHGERMDLFLQRVGSVRYEQAMEIMQNLCDALAYLHGRTPQLIYGDLKPANVMLLPNRKLKLIDFGSVQTVDERKKYQMGTPGYAAPEQLKKDGQIDARSDVYSFGVLFYELLIGEKFDGVYLENPFIDADVREIIFHCTRMNQKSRYADMREVMQSMNKKQRRNGGLFLMKKGKQPFVIQDLERTILQQNE